MATEYHTADLLNEKESASNKQYRTCLDEWKEIIVLLHEMIVDETKWFTVITIMCITCLYLYIWMANCLMINVIWAIGLCAILVDCIVCGPLQNIWPPDNWDQKKEYIYSTFCETVSEDYSTFKLYIERFFKLRETNTKLFHCTLSLLFFCLLYIGTPYNNLVMSYFTVVSLFVMLKVRSEDIEKSFQEYTNTINDTLTIKSTPLPKSDTNQL